MLSLWKQNTLKKTPKKKVCTAVSWQTKSVRVFLSSFHEIP